MTDLNELRRVAKAAAEMSLASTDVIEIEIEPDINDDGEDLLRVRVVIPDGTVDTIDFQQFFDAIVNIKQGVRESGDDRRTMVGFITPTELADLASPES